MSHPKKLIEVSIPLKEINEACAREKSIRHGHPSTLHLWWARRPLAAARAVLFCQLVDDPSGYADELVKDKARAKITEQELLMEPEGEKDLSPRLRERLVEKERERLHDMVRKLVIWENTTNESLFKQARQEILKSWQRHLKREGKPLDTPMPPVLDPFAGGGAIPLEAQRLGMEAHASDLNPVAVLINKAMIEIPPKFAGLPPVNPEWQGKTKEEKAANTWKGAQGLAADVRYYGNWMREEAKKRIGHLYPPYTLTQELIDGRPDLKKAGYTAGDELTVIAWLWARTVPSPNPALQGKPVPLVSSFWLSKKKGKEAYVEPVVENGDYHFEIRVGKPKDATAVEAGTKNGRGANFECVISGIPIGDGHVKEAGRSGNMGAKLMAVVCEGSRGRVYLKADQTQNQAAEDAKPTWRPTEEQPKNPRWFSPPDYGMPTYGDLFTPRQLVALTTFSDLVEEARSRVLADTQAVGHLPDEDGTLEQSGIGGQAYADAVAVYLAFAISRAADRGSSICTWDSSPKMEALRNTFGRQAVPMTWDFAEGNHFSSSSGNITNHLEWGCKFLEITASARTAGFVSQQNSSIRQIISGTIISSDPPYYDNIGYADLSDFFYVWLRRSLRSVLPQAMGSILVPKTEELIASPYRHGGKAKAESFFLDGMTAVAHRWAEFGSKVYPTTIYYAFKQSEIKTEGLVSTGWAVFLGALMEAGFSVGGTWPMRTEMVNKIGQSANMLASSIVLVCRQRPQTAQTITKREFIEALESELPEALRELQQANLSPVDLPQSAIGPGMAIFSRYAAVVKGDGQPMSVTEALQLINHELGHLLDGQISDMDAHTRFACKWFAQHGFSAAPYGDAELIATALTFPCKAWSPPASSNPAKARPACSSPPNFREDGTRKTTHTSPSGKSSTTSSASPIVVGMATAQKSSPPSAMPRSPRPGSSPTASSPCATSRSGAISPSLTTNSSPTGRTTATSQPNSQPQQRSPSKPVSTCEADPMMSPAPRQPRPKKNEQESSRQSSSSLDAPRAFVHPRPMNHPLDVLPPNIRNALHDLLRREQLPGWPQRPKPAFGGFAPLQFIKRGESNRLRQMIYELESGQPS